MKKSLLAIILALFTLGSCTPKLDVPEISKDNMYFGLTMNSAMLTHKGLAERGDDESSYVLRLATIDVNDMGEAATTRILSLDLKFNLVDGKIPEGEYSFGNLELSEGAFSNILSGSTYVNMESGDYNTYAMWLINKGKLTVKHGKDNAYIMDVDFEAKKLNKEAGIAVGKTKPIVCHYEGEVDICGLPENFIYTSYQPYFAYAVYYPLIGNQTYWDLYIMDENYFNVFLNQQATGKEGTYSAYFTEYQIICDENGMILPQGQFDLDTYATLTSKTMMAAAFMKVDITESIIKNEKGEDIVYINQEESSYLDMMSDGFVKITSKGQGLYDITTETYGIMGAYKSKATNCQVQIIPGYTGADRQNVDFKFTEGVMYYMGRVDYGNGIMSVPYWNLGLYDNARKEIVALGVNVEVGNNFSTGIPSGTYIANESGNGFTVDLGVEDQNRNVYGSYIIQTTADGQVTPCDLITSGVLEVTNHGDGTYKFVLDMKGNNDNYIKGTFEGKLEIVDNTASNSSGAVGSGQSEAKVMGDKRFKKIVLPNAPVAERRTLIGNTKGFYGNYATFMQ